MPHAALRGTLFLQGKPGGVEVIECPECAGTGKINPFPPEYSEGNEHKVVCPRCNRTGELGAAELFRAPQAQQERSELPDLLELLLTILCLLHDMR